MAHKPKDIFMNFASFHHDITGGDSSILNEQKVPTGLSVRGELIWVVHLVEAFMLDVTGNVISIDWAISTVADLATMPSLRDKGILARGRQHAEALSSGKSYAVQPQRQVFFPPIPVAAPNLSFYVQASANHADAVGLYMARLGYTTEEADAETALEIAEVWGG